VEGLQLILVIVGAIVVTAYAHRRDLQPPLVITVVGLAASFVPGVSGFQLDSDIILGVVLPPLLYSAAQGFALPSFIRQLRAILVLGVGLVIATAFAVAGVGALAVGGLTFSTALVLGAVVAPPDAVSAVAIGRSLGLRRRVLSVLTGESLVNDAAALTLFTVAVASITGEHTLVDSPVLLFLYSAAVGIASGVALAIVALNVRRHLRNAGLETVLGLVVPFAAYLLAESLEASGVLAVVAAGFLVGTLSVRFDYETRLQERNVWAALDVLLEAFVFAYMGLQLRFVVADLTSWSVLGGGLLVLATVLLIRPLVLFLTLGAGLVVEDRPDDPGVVRMTRRLAEINERLAARGRRPARPAQPLTWREALVISWTGMRGVVTVAAAAAVPAALPGRPEIQAIAYLVAVATLVLQGATLPWLIARLNVRDPAEDRVVEAQQRDVAAAAREAATGVMKAFADDPPPGVSADFIRRASERQEVAVAERAALGTAMGQLTRDVIAAQRQAIIGGLRDGTLDADAVREYLEQLDYQEAALASRLGGRL